MVGKNGGHTSSIADIFNALHSYYMGWGDKVLAHFLAMFRLFVGKSF
jgi:hypothetical protein